ncbi:MAG: hypothetical protein IIB94_10130 [Candidatus Marinimicrobia bacterium]|nr:hypothetical protein [Candidatus Neomarinimicrobiota bacterium]
MNKFYHEVRHNVLNTLRDFVAVRTCPDAFGKEFRGQDPPPMAGSRKS